jgi:hypothetical protein
MEKKMEKYNERNVERENPFMAYAIRKGIVGGKDLTYDERMRKPSPQEKTVFRLSKNWNELNEKTPWLYSAPHLETSDSGAVFEWNLDSLRKGYLNYARDSKLSNLPNFQDDKVYQKLEDFKNKLGYDFYSYNLRYDQSTSVLAKIAFTYLGMVDRTMKQEEYEGLVDSSYENFRDKCLARKE